MSPFLLQTLTPIGPARPPDGVPMSEAVDFAGRAHDDSRRVGWIDPSEQLVEVGDGDAHAPDGRYSRVGVNEDGGSGVGDSRVCVVVNNGERGVLRGLGPQRLAASPEWG
jgi:hypothetical protein